MSRTRTTEPSGSERITMLLNCSTSARLPAVCTGKVSTWPRSAGAWPISPTGKFWFCSRTAPITSLTVSRYFASRSGSTHSRIA